ncbi:putative cyclin-dependent kinase F-2 [Lolium rigidum]|uniref:putative cyclin-dependent kinase F-2 n=1 Tax=Lolium rigidum TaxID=89674 RepID=UPI001F5DCE94|nr:putative cyclin-dependent kinase F-2 [Lolium rigidum]
MAACKRPAAVLDAGHATTTQGSSAACKRSRHSVRSSDDYEEVARLGKGGFGVVVQARHRVTGKTVAIKYAADLEQEASFLAACSGNPYVVGFDGLMRDHATGGHCLAMEYVAAPSLHAFLWERRHHSPLPESKVRAFMWKLLTGTKMMHDRHVVHRDIKPANILIGQDGELVKMCDLGLALHMSDSPPYSQVGTVPYMAPEMLLHKPDYDALVDTWSLGCVMAEMLTGKILFYDDDDDDGHQDQFNDTTHIVQLWSIFRVLGMPDDRTWPEFKSLPLTAKFQQLLPGGLNHNRLRDMFPEERLSEQGFQVLQGLLTCNPDKRLTAAKALKHPWFTAPRPSVAAAKVEALPLRRKKRPGFLVALAAALKAQQV